MRPFEYFLKNNEVKQICPDKKEADDIREDAYSRFSYFSSQKLEEYNAKFIFENLYESIREMLDAELLEQGYKSYSHQASIVFAK